ncbi:MAG: thioredoxin family protein [Gemmataceae bacterium]|nr:thioredoxin family protein [Gemmataceae bacterium]
MRFRLVAVCGLAAAVMGAGMQRWVMVVGVVLGAPAVAQCQKGANAGKYGWQSSWETARAEARRSGKPLFVVFRCEP